jgi:hypothetical protein
MPGKYTHTNRAQYSVLTGDIYNADHQNHIDHLEPQYIDRDGTNLADMQAVSDPGNDGSETQPTTLRDEIRQLRNEIKVIKSYIAQTAPSNWYSKLSATNRAHLLRDGTLAMTGKLSAKSGAGGTLNPNNCGVVFDNDNDSGLFGISDGVVGIYANGVELFEANKPADLLKIFRPILFPATQVSSSDPNALDDYEEGTWTPTLERDTTNPTLTYTSQTGTYTKIGRAVIVAGYIVVNTVTAQGSGVLRIGGLPFYSTAPRSAIIATVAGWPSYTSTNAVSVSHINVGSVTYLYLVETKIGLPGITVNIDNGLAINFQYFYYTYT